MFVPEANFLESLKKSYPDAKLTISGTDTELYMWCPLFRYVFEYDDGNDEPGTLAFVVHASKSDDGTIECRIEEFYTFDSWENGST